MSTNNLTAQPGIYQIRCLANGKFYVGSSCNLKRRWCDHRKLLRRGNHPNQRLQRAWVKYGEPMFLCEVLDVLENPDDLMSSEQRYLDILKPFVRDVGYNISPTANSPRGVKRSDETRAKLSIAAKNQFASPEARAALSDRAKAQAGSGRLGKKHTEESKRKISERTKQRMADPEVRERLIAARKRYAATEEGRATLLDRSKRGLELAKRLAESESFRGES